MEPIASTSVHEAAETADLETTIQRIFDEQLGLGAPAADADLIAAGTLDSLVLVRLLVALEEHLGTRIALDRLEMSDFRSISRIARFLSRNGNGSGNGYGR